MKKIIKKKKIGKMIEGIPNVISVPTAWLVPEKPNIGELPHDFGREDLNAMRDKINEIIRNL